MLAADLPRRLSALVVFLLLTAAAWVLLESVAADYVWAKTGIFLFVLFLLLGSGVWIGLALMGVAYVGVEAFTVRPAGDAMITTIWSSSSSWTLTALPLFIWMGEILFRTRLSEDMFRGLAPWTARLPGGLLHTNVVGCTIFAAVSGSSAATLMTVGKMSVPELRQRRYPEFMTIGTLAGSATLGLMIPPSLTLIVYGVTINESITKLFIAGILPGLALAALFMGTSPPGISCAGTSGRSRNRRWRSAPSCAIRASWRRSSCWSCRSSARCIWGWPRPPRRRPSA